MQLIQILIIGLVLGGVYALMAIGLTLTFGVMRIVNLAHTAFIILSAYVAYWLFQIYSIDPFVSIFITMPIFFVLGALIYKFLFSRIINSPRFMEMTVLLTFGIARIVEGMMGYLWTGIYRSSNTSYTTSAFKLGELFVPVGQLYGALVSVGLLGLLWLFLYQTRMGYAVRATMENRTASQIVGVNVEQVYMLSFGIGTALAGASGSILSYLFAFYPASHWQWLSIVLSLIVLGGLGSLKGALIGALILAISAGYVSHFFGSVWSPATFYLALFLILLIRPEGLFGEKLEV